MRPQKLHPSEARKQRRSQAVMRLAAAADEYKDGRIKKDRVEMCVRVALGAGIGSNVISELTGWDRAVVLGYK